MISYTMPCHKRQADLARVLPSLLTAKQACPYLCEIVVVDYGNEEPLALPHAIRRVECRAQHFHMAHARNFGIRSAWGDIICAFVCDQIVQPNFFLAVQALLRPGVFLAWQETFVFYRADVIDAGGFDERFELYGPEGKELAERLERRGLRKVKIPHDLVYQIPTDYYEKIANYSQKLSRREMHHIGMDTWKECQGQLVANEGKNWGSTVGPEHRTYSDEYVAEIKQRIELKKKEHLAKMARMEGATVNA